MNDKIFEFAYNMAFRDATMRKAFPRFDSEMLKNEDSNEKKIGRMNCTAQGRRK